MENGRKSVLVQCKRCGKIFTDWISSTRTRPFQHCADCFYAELMARRITKREEKRLYDNARELEEQYGWLDFIPRICSECGCQIVRSYDYDFICSSPTCALVYEYMPETKRLWGKSDLTEFLRDLTAISEDMAYSK